MHILMFSDFALPDSCANATRVFSFAQLFRQSGHDVSLLGIAYQQGADLAGTYKDFDYEMLQAKPYYGLKAYKRTADLNRQIAAYLERKQTEWEINAIFLSNVYYDFASVFQRFSRKHKVSLIVNQVEWYEKDNAQFKGPTGKLNFIKNRIALRYIHKKMKNILAISSLLDDYYKARGCNTVTVPTIVDPAEYAAVAHAAVRDRDEVHIAYAGAPGKKDYVLNAVRALPLLTDEERKRIRLHFYGVTEEQLRCLGLSEHLDNVVCHGRIPYEQVKDKIADADFTVLLRPNLRYANAGFPTKVGESMACGTPVIANLTSDLDRYVLDGKTGFVCADETAESCAEAFRKALGMTDAKLQDMREQTLQLSKTAFDYRAYTETVQSFLQRAKMGAEGT